MAKTALRVKQARKPKFAVRAYTRCQKCGRPKAVYRKFGLCRVCLRDMAHKGELPGITKSSSGLPSAPRRLGAPARPATPLRTTWRTADLLCVARLGAGRQF